MKAAAEHPEIEVLVPVEQDVAKMRRFVEDFFTEPERESILPTEDALRDRHVALIWSAKESALKVLRVGLRRDTRSVFVEIDDPTAPGPLAGPD